MRRRRFSFKEPVVIALGALRAHKLRSFLTLLGVIISVFTLIGVMSIIEGLNRYIAERVADFGANVFYVGRYPIITNAKDWLEARRRNPKMTVEDMDYLRDNAWVPVACVVFSVALVLPMALGTLACSAVTSSRRYAAAAAITLLAANGFLAGMLSSILNMRSVQLLAIPEAMAWLGTALFQPNVHLPMPLPGIVCIVTSVALIGFVVLWRRIKRVEVGL